MVLCLIIGAFSEAMEPFSFTPVTVVYGYHGSILLNALHSDIILLAVPIFAVTLALLIWAKNDPNGFNAIWKYMGWANQANSPQTPA